MAALDRFFGFQMVPGFRGALGSATVFAFWSFSMARTLFVFLLYCCLTTAGDWLCLVGLLSLVELLPWFNHTVDGMGILSLVRAVLIG